MGISGTTTNYNLTKYETGSDDWGAGMNNNMDTIDSEIKNASDKGLTVGEKAQFTELTDGSTTTLHNHSGILTAKQMFVISNGGTWCEIKRASTTEIYIMPKPSPLGSFIGAVLSDGTYLERTTKITLDISNSAHHLDGFGQFTNQFYKPWLYNNGGTLDAGFTLYPKTTINGANPDGNTNPISLNQLNSKDIGYLFNVNGSIAVWQDSTDFETPIFSYGGSYDADGELYTSSRTSTALTLNKDLIITDFADASTIFQIDNFKPVKIADGTDAISAWVDTGFAVRTNGTGSGELENFVIIGDELYYTNGNGSANYTYLSGIETIPCATTPTVKKMEYVPVDAVPILVAGGDGTYKHMSFCYWQDYGESMIWGGQSVIKESTKAKHGLIKLALGYSGATNNEFVRGYKKLK